MRSPLRCPSAWLACVAIGAALLAAATARAQAPAFGSDALGGGRHVGSARVDAPAVRGLVSVGYAHTESVLGQNDRHERAFLGLAAAWIAKPWMQIALRWDNRYDVHHGEAGKDTGLSGSPELSTRHAFAFAKDWAAAGQLRLRFPFASSAGRSFAATTTELAAIFTRKILQHGEVSLQAGYRFDRSDQAYPRTYALTAADALATSMSRSNAVLLGALVAVPVGSFTAVGEWSWEPFTGSAAPALGAAPLRLRAALQRQFGERLVPSIELGVNLAQRPTFETYTRIEPRVWAAANLGLLLDKKPPPPPAPPPPTVVAPEPAPMMPVTLTVLAADRNPAASARVTWSSERGTREAIADEAGRALFEGQVGERAHITVYAEGAAPLEQDIVVGEASPELTVQLHRALPEGELKGYVRSLRGVRIKARVELLPSGQVLDTREDGSFQLSVPPGDYRLRVTAPGHEPQERSARVERMGVTIVLIDLRKSKP